MGFDADTVLPEFGGRVLPERDVPIGTSLELAESGGAVVGRYVDESAISASIAGVYDAATNTLTLEGECNDWRVSFEGAFRAGVVDGSVLVRRDQRSGTASVEERRIVAGAGDHVEVGDAYYVDAVDGDDSSTGTSPEAPLATLGALRALLKGGEHVRLARGSNWREDLDVPDLVVHMEDYGIGPRPIINAFEVVAPSGWSPVAGTANVFQRVHTPEDDISVKGMYVVLEDGVALTGVADVEACDEGPGSFVAPALDGSGPYTIHMHPRGGTDPREDGKTYEIVTRSGVAVLGSTSTLRGVYARGAVQENGPVRCAPNDANDAPVLSDVISSWGGKHGFYMPGGRAHSCGVVGLAPNLSAGTAWVLNRNAGDGVAWLLEDCFAVNLPVVAAAQDAVQSRVAPVNGHINVGGSFGPVLIDRFGAAYMNNGAVVDGSDEGTTWRNCLLEKLVTTTSSVCMIGAASDRPLSVEESRLYGHTSASGHRLIGGGAGSGAVVVTDSILTTRYTSGGDIRANRKVEVARCVVRHDTDTASRYFLSDSGAEASYSVSRTIVLASADYANLTEGSLHPNTDLNVFQTASASVREGPDAVVRELSQYLSDQDVYDRNSTILLPEFRIGTDSGDRPTFELEVEWLEALPSAFGGEVGPAPALPDGTGWVTPETYDSWKSLIESL